MEYIIALLILFVIIGAVQTRRQQRQHRKQLWADYQEALREGDKIKALAAGRRYYASYRRNGRLTTYDEQSLTNDLSTLK